MDDFAKKFIEEANDLLDTLEEALLNLENNPGDEAQINEVFRVMHSLKGTGAMFGFEKLSSFTHEMENVYDLVRSNKLSVTKELIDLTFESIDLIKSLLYDSEDEKTGALSRQLLARLKNIVSEKVSDPNLEEKTGQRKNYAGKKSGKEKPESTFFVHFQPDPGILKNGTHPLFLIDEFFENGTCKVFLRTGQIPSLDKIVPDNTYVYWDIFIATAKDENFIRDIFIFVEDESVLEIKKLADENWVSRQDFGQACEQLNFRESIDEEKLAQLTQVMQVEKVSAHAVKADTEKQVKVPETSGEAQKESLEWKEETPTVQDETFVKEDERKTFEKELTHIKQEGLTTIRVSAEKLDKMLNLISELVTVQARLEHFSHRYNHPVLSAVTEDYQKLSRQLRENALDMRLIPIYNMITRFKRLVRDLSRELNKEVQLITTGTETELDKSIIEKLYDPIMHIIRNSMDHGIESREEREKAGKNPVGKIFINTYYSGTNVVIKISDDGAGIDVEKIRQKAIRKKMISEHDQLSENDIINFIFQPGFTTTTQITDISGRGVGMDVVKKNIGDLRGEIEITTEKGKGSTTTIILPLTLSIIDGLLIYIGKSRYVIPLDNVKQVFSVTRKEVEESFDGIIIRENRQIPFVDLVSEFNQNVDDDDESHLVVLHFEEREMGFVINSIEGKYQAVIKPLSRFVQKHEIFSGATVLGDGSVALVMDTLKIINRYINND